ncbi:MAG: hypothetical protein KAH20_04940 [Methylococcales bacterium]|nr:hypothetical protein [Methylococcales bacterium]
MEPGTIQSAGATMVFSLALGDLSAIVSLATILPTTWGNLKYSRVIE